MTDHPLTVILPLGCTRCPFHAEIDGLHRCQVVAEAGRRPRTVWQTAPAPDWCPLRSGPVTVESAS